MPSTNTQNSTRMVRRVLLVGLQGIEWSYLANELNGEGLPNLAALLHSGVNADLAVPSPHVAESAWTSLITGKRAHKHDVLHALQSRPSGRGTERVSRPTVRAATLGAILSEAGLTVHQIGWPVSHPAEQLRGIAVSDRFALEGRSDSLESQGGWPWMTPSAAAREIFARRCRPQDIEEVTLAQLLPAELISPSTHGPLQQACRAVLAESQTLFNATRWCMQRGPWDCTVCAFPALSRLREALAALPSEQRPQESATLLAGCYEHLDMLLGQLIASAGEEAAVVLVGMDDPRPRHAQFVIQSSALSENAVVDSAASILDVLPTLLAMLGVATARDGDGRVWTELFDLNEQACDSVDSWDTCVHPPQADSDLRPDSEPLEVDESVRHLAELGYVDPLEMQAEQRAATCGRDARRNRVLSLLDAGLEDEAIEELNRLKDDFPDWPAPYELLAEIFLQRQDIDSASHELEFLIHHGAESARLYLSLGHVAVHRRDWRDALTNYHFANQVNSTLRGVQLAYGIALLRTRDFQAAEQTLLKALASEGRSAELLDLLANCCLGLNKDAEATEYALAAVEQNASFAPAHYHLGLALLRLNRPEDATQALQLANTLDRDFAAATRWLARIHRDYLRNLPQADAYRQQGREIIRRRRQARRADDT